jgi:hypothetical protein
MLSSLALRERVNCDKIREYSRKIEQAGPDRGEFTVAQVDSYAREYAFLATEISAAVQAHPQADWLTHVHALIQRKAVSLMSQVGTLTGEVYTTQTKSNNEEEMEVPRSRRIVRLDAIEKIDWF